MLRPLAVGLLLGLVAWTQPVSPRTAFDAALDDESGPFTGVEVRTHRSVRDGEALHDDGVAFFKSARLAAGPVHTAFVGFWSGRPGAEMHLSNAGRGASLSALAAHPAETALTLGGVPVLRHVDRDDGSLTVRWAGDLDRDGRLDLLLDATPHGNLSRLQLWLSSAAGEGTPLGLVAEQSSTGC